MRRVPALPWAATLLAALAATGWAAVRAADLGVAVRVEDLLPDGAPAADDYRRFLAAFGGFETVYAMVLWRGAGEPDTALLAEAADRVADEVAALPEVTSARSGLAPGDEEFLRRHVLPRAPLFLGPNDPDELLARFEPAAVRERVREIRRALVGPAGAAQGRWLAADPLGLSGGPAALASGGAMALVDPLTGAFVSPAGDAALVVVTPASGELDAAAGRRLAAGLDGAFRDARRELGAPLALAAVGGPLYAAEDERIVRRDLALAVTGSATVVLLLLVLYFGSPFLALALAGSVGAGVAWTAGLAAATLGEVSVLGLSFAAMLLGLGVDYGIHGATRFREGVLAGAARGPAMRGAFAETGPAILASAATTAAAFAVLGLAHFRPVRELGVVMAAGIAALLGASLAVGAPLLVLARGPRRVAEPGGAGPPPRGAVWRGLGRAVEKAVGTAERRPAAVAVAAAASLGLALWGVSRLELSVDLRALRPADHPAFAAEELLGERFGLGLDVSTVVVEGASPGDALDRARAVEAAVRRVAGPEVEIGSAADWLPAGAVVARRVGLLGGEPAAGAAAALRSETAAQGLDPRAFTPALAVLDELARGEAPPRIPPSARPDWLRETIRTGADGRTRVAVRLAGPLGAWPEGPPSAVLRAIEAAAPGAAVASVPRLGSELRRLVAGDLERLGGWALAAVVAVVVASFLGRPRPLARALLALLPVTLGGLWTAGLAGLAGARVDPFTLIVAPVLLGIGIDDGLHALQGVRVHGGLAASLRANGRAMVLTTLTTCAGFGSLALSRVPSLRTAGLLVAVGTFLCLVATLLVLPAVAELVPALRPAGERRAS